MCSALLQSYWLQILVQNLLKCSTRVICRKSVLYSHVTAHVAFTPFSTVPEAMETDDSSKVSFSTCTFDDDAVSFDRVSWISEVDLGEQSYPWLHELPRNRLWPSPPFRKLWNWLRCSAWMLLVVVALWCLSLTHTLSVHADFWNCSAGRRMLHPKTKSQRSEAPT